MTLHIFYRNFSIGKYIYCVLLFSQISDSISVNKFYATLSDDKKEKIANGPELGDFIHDNPQVNAENIKRKKGER